MEALIDNLIAWVKESSLSIIVIIALAALVARSSGLLIEKLVRRLVVQNHTLTKEDERQREDTIIRILTGTIHVLIILMAGMMVLSELGVAIGPLLAGAGIVGLAFGFGGQYLIRDIISGLFIILENQYRVGDVVCLGATCGLVEDISLRMTVLRDLDGVVHHVPNGEITQSSNLSKYFARVNLNVGVSYDSNIEHVIGVVNKVGQGLADDLEWKPFILKAPQFLRVDNFGDSAMIIKILGETKPLKQWDVAGELRKRLKIAFDAEGIEIALPQRVIHTSARRSTSKK